MVQSRINREGADVTTPVPPGWYPDPLGGEGARYWDGTEWEGAIHPHPPADVQEFPEPATTPEKQPQSWLLWAGLGAAAVVAVGSLAFALTRPTGDAPEAEPAPTLTAPTPTFTAPAPMVSPAEQAAATVKVSMQRKFDSDPDLKELDLTVVDVMLVNKAGNEFKGIATVRTPDGEEHDVPIDVTSDNDNALWEAPPGAFLFAVDPPLPPPPLKPPRPAAPPVPPDLVPDTGEGFRMCPSGLTGVASEDTSCAFADSVRSAWYSQPGRTVTAFSPVTRQSYVMTCAPAVTDAWPNSRRCVGTNAQGTLLIVYIN